MKAFRDFILSDPKDTDAFFAFLIVPPGPPFPEHKSDRSHVVL